MDTVAGFLNQQNSFKVKAVSQVQLALALIATAWEPNLTGAVAVLGILASVLGSHELLQLVRRPGASDHRFRMTHIQSKRVLSCAAVYVLHPSINYH